MDHVWMSTHLDIHVGINTFKNYFDKLKITLEIVLLVRDSWGKAPKIRNTTQMSGFSLYFYFCIHLGLFHGFVA